MHLNISPRRDLMIFLVAPIASASGGSGVYTIEKETDIRDGTGRHCCLGNVQYLNDAPAI